MLRRRHGLAAKGDALDLEAVAAEDAAGMAWLRSLLVWRVSPGYYAVALLLPVAIYAVINLILVVLGGRLDLTPLLVIGPGYIGTFLMVATVGGGLEYMFAPSWSAKSFTFPAASFSRLVRSRQPGRVAIRPSPTCGSG